MAQATPCVNFLWPRTCTFSDLSIDLKKEKNVKESVSVGREIGPMCLHAGMQSALWMWVIFSICLPPISFPKLEILKHSHHYLKEKGSRKNRPPS